MSSFRPRLALEIAKWWCNLRSVSLVELKTMVLDLPAAERGELAATLVESLELPDPNDADLDSVAEAANRAKELDSGSVKAIPEKEFWNQVQSDRH